MASTHVGVSGDESVKPAFNAGLRKGQRKYGGPPLNWTGPPPTKGSEVFVGKIPRDLTEDDLLPLFESIGSIYEMRLMMDLNGGNRGFAFVTFATPSDATKAIQQLNRYEIRPKRFIGVIKSLDNCRLFVGGIPKDKTEEDILEEMSRLTDGVVRVILYSSIADKSKNRGFAFVEYESHRSAAVARRKCMPGRLQMWGKNVAVDWAEPEPIVEEEILSKVRILYVRNLMISTTEEELLKLFNDASDNGVEKVKILNDFAFVHFINRLQAEQAMDVLQNKELNGSKIQITWAKPVTEKNKKCSLQTKAAAARKPPLLNPPRYPATVSQIWPHVTFSSAIQPLANNALVNNLPLQTFPPYSFFPQYRPIGNYFVPTSRRHNQVPVDVFQNIPLTSNNFVHLQHQDTLPSALHHEGQQLQWMNGGFTDNVKALTNLCRLHNIGEPLFESCKGPDDRYSAKISVPNLGPPYNVFQVADTYETEEEAHQALSGCAISYIDQNLRQIGGDLLNSQLENLSLKDTTLPGPVFPVNFLPPV